MDGRTESSVEGKAKLIKNFYEEIYKAREVENKDRARIVEEFQALIGTPPGVNFDERFTAKGGDHVEMTTTSELKEMSRRINNKRSAGADGLSNHMIRKLPEIFWEKSAVLFNQCLANGYFPSAWKSAIIIPLPKVQDPKTPGEYRPRVKMGEQAVK